MNVQHRRQEGSVLLVTLVISAIIGFTLASYLTLVSSQNKSIVRSMAWNSAIAVIEAGIEEALTHIHHNGTTNLGINGWGYANGNYVKKAELGADFYEVSIEPVEPPVIVSRGYVKEPVIDKYLPARVVQVTTKKDPLWAKGLVAKGAIDLAGQNIATDSFDSSDPNFSDGGRYDPKKNKDDGDVATNSAVIDTLNIWNADIMGEVSTGPGGVVKIGPTGSVGSKEWVGSGKNGIQPGWSNDDMNVSFPDVIAPTTDMTPSGGTVGMIYYKYILNDGSYSLPSLELGAKDKVLVSGNAVLYVRGDLSISGTDSGIVIDKTGSLKLYVAGDRTSIGGNGVVNEAGNAMNFQYYGLPTNTAIDFAGNASFVGAIYAPNADFTLSGGGSDVNDFIGSSVSRTVKMNGHFRFHYDEALGKFGPIKGYVVASWNEI